VLGGNMPTPDGKGGKALLLLLLLLLLLVLLEREDQCDVTHAVMP